MINYIKPFVAGVTFAIATVPAFGEASSLPILSDFLGGGDMLSTINIPDFSDAVLVPMSLLSNPDATLNALDPQTLVGMGADLALPLAQQFLPILEVLVTDPTGIVDFFSGGGTLISPILVIAPAIPLITAPLPGL